MYITWFECGNVHLVCVKQLFSYNVCSSLCCWAI